MPRLRLLVPTADTEIPSEVAIALSASLPSLAMFSGVQFDRPWCGGAIRIPYGIQPSIGNHCLPGPVDVFSEKPVDSAVLL
jgi:hypothetical protein